MAATEKGRLLTEAHRQAQYQIRAAALRDAQVVARLLDPRRVDESFPEYRRRMAAVVAKGRAQSAATSAAYYRAFREAEGAKRPLDRLPLATALPGGLDTSLRVTGPVAVKQATSNGFLWQQAANLALQSTLGAVGRHVLNGGRDTIVGAVNADEEAQGIARVTDGSPCSFCAMLAGRGAVYKSDQTASFLPHDKCGCQPEPMLQRGALPESSKPFADLWERSTRGKSGASARRAFAEAYERERPSLVKPRTGPGSWLPKKTRTWTASEDLQAVNSARFRNGRAYQVNCTHCVAAHELRRRGYDVQATPLPRDLVPRGGRTHSDYLGRWEKPDGGSPIPYGVRNKTGAITYIRELLPDGASGGMIVKWKGGGGHTFSFERRGDKVTFSDPQTGQESVDFWKNVSRDNVFLYRLDDCKPRDSLQEFVTKREGG